MESNDSKNTNAGQEAYLDATQLEQWIARDYERIDDLTAMMLSGEISINNKCLALAEIEDIGKRILANRLLAIQLRWEVAS